MAAITDLSDLVNRLTGGNSGTPEVSWFHKVARVGGSAAAAAVTGRLTSLWQHDGIPGGGAVVGAAAVPTNATAGALTFTNPGGGREKHMLQAIMSASLQSNVILYDRLLHVGGLSGTSVSAQDVQGASYTPALTRYTDGVGNVVFYEIQTTIGITSRTLTMTYTDDEGNTDQTATINIGATGFREAYAARLIPLAAGDRGVRAVKSVQLDASTGTAGDFGIVIAHPIAFIGASAAGAAGWRDFTTGIPGIPTIPANACLGLLVQASTTTLPEITGALSFVEK